MTTTYRQRRRTQQPSPLWSALVLVGMAVTVLGVLLITNPFSTPRALAVLAGVALVVSGIGETISAARSEHSASSASFGLLLAAAGVVILLWPGATLRVIALVVGAGLVAGGVVRALFLWATRRGRPRGVGRGLLIAALSVAVGVIALLWPTATIAALAVLFGIQLVATGVMQISLGLALRPRY